MTDRAGRPPAAPEDRHPPVYRGRFAPSPTGPLHFGSLVTAVGSFLEARRHGGLWLVRIEDLDPPREVPGASAEILRTLEAYGLHWDGPVLYQSTRAAVYEEALDQLFRSAALYPCGCSRREVLSAGRVHEGAVIYPGTCREGLPPGRKPLSLRVRTHAACIGFRDHIQGHRVQVLEEEVGDFVLRRADGLYAYQLAVVVDDAAQGITHVVRGSDLLDSTPRQIHLQRLLGAPTPDYAHLPIAVNARGEKLSKQTGAKGLSCADPVPVLWRVLTFLDQDPPSELQRASLSELWSWALAHWRPARIPGCRTKPEKERRGIGRRATALRGPREKARSSF
jgi:glutamyl-Q tRNA(Asp) synthetase